RPVKPTSWSAYLWTSCAVFRFRSRAITTRSTRPGPPFKPRSGVWLALFSVRLVPSSAAGQLAPLSDRSFEDYDRAVAQIAEPLAPDTVLAYEQGYLDAHFVYPISSPLSGLRYSRRSAPISGITSN